MSRYTNVQVVWRGEGRELLYKMMKTQTLPFVGPFVQEKIILWNILIKHALYVTI